MRAIAERLRNLFRGTHPRSYDGGAYRVESRWKEEVIYWEGARGYLFDAGWGVRPPVLYLPSERLWDRVVPEWLKWRRPEVIQRLVAHSGHVLEDTDEGYERPEGVRSPRELAPVTSAAEAREIVIRYLGNFAGILGYYELRDTVREDGIGWIFSLQRRADALTFDDGTAVPESSAFRVRRDTGEVDEPE